MKDGDFAVIRRIGLAIGVAILAYLLTEALGLYSDGCTLAAIGGALVGFFIPPRFQKK